jgi:hypothetical protein
VSLGHSAPITAMTAHARSARDSQLTAAILPALNRRLRAADNPDVNTPALVIPYFALWATLMRALFVKARLLPATCARCGLKLERRELGEPVCTCGR